MDTCIWRSLGKQCGQPATHSLKDNTGEWTAYRYCRLHIQPAWMFYVGRHSTLETVGPHTVLVKEWPWHYVWEDTGEPVEQLHAAQPLSES